MSTDLSGKKVAHYGKGKEGFVGFLTTPFYNAWQYRELIRVIVGRELRQRFRDSYFGWIWAVIAPLAMLAVFVKLFSSTLRIATGTTTDFALSIFVALILFNAFAGLISRAPMLLPENAHFIKKSIFPSEVLAWTSMVRTLVYAGIGFVVFLFLRSF